MSLDDDDQCFNWVDYPLEVEGAYGGLLENTPLICGGRKTFMIYTDECYSLNEETSKFVTRMSVNRIGGTSIVLNETILWISGGRVYEVLNSGKRVASSEYINLSGSTPGPDLPMNLMHHAKIAINTTHSMVIGGSNSTGLELDLTFFFDHVNQKWVDGPTLIQERSYGHAVGIVNDQVTMANLAIVTGGVAGYGEYYIISTEILVDSKWLPGKKMPIVPCYNKILCMLP